MRVIAKLILVLTALWFYSCKKVIDIKLKETDIKYVVEGIVSNKAGDCKVYVSKSKPFNENNEFEKVSGAIVTVSDNGVEVQLGETQAGIYQTNLINGTPGHVYQMTVSVNGETFSASCTMPQPVRLDTLYIAPGPLGKFQFANIAYTDPPGINNAYRFIQYKNGIKDPAIFVQDDKFTDGQTVVTRLDTGVDKEDDPRNIESGDEVVIEMLTVDESIFKYWNSLRSAGGDGSTSTASPANPVTNIKGGALGYFSAHTISQRMVVAP